MRSNAPTMIYHITERTAWETAGPAYTSPSLETEGFIHCSRAEQVAATANRFYRGRHGLVLLVIDPAKLRAELRHEAAVDGAGVFPHIHGPLNADAVTGVLPLPCGADGGFAIEL